MPRVSKRKQPRDRAETKLFRRQQLIDATIDSIAKRGFADTTLADVADGAGLSRGLVNFHFASKDSLLVETLKYVTEEYHAFWTRVLERSGPSAADRLYALTMADFDPTVSSRRKLAVWHAFYGEAKSRPTYMKLCAERDAELIAVRTGLCREIIEEGGYSDVDAEAAARGIGAVVDGLWVDLLLSPKWIDRDAARKVAALLLSRMFPGHFPLDQGVAA